VLPDVDEDVVEVVVLSLSPEKNPRKNSGTRTVAARMQNRRKKTKTNLISL